jgi:hypothetical protein
MFTVKWIYDASGVSRERVFETETVEVAFDNRDDVPAGCPVSQVSAKLGVYHVPPRGVVVIGNPHNGAESMAFAHGNVYVMNSDGNTISKYKLAEVPHGYCVDVEGQKSVPASV